MSFDSLRDLSGTIRAFEDQARDSERQTSSALAVCYAIVFFTYGLLFLPVNVLEGTPLSVLYPDILGLMFLGLISLAYSYFLNRRFPDRFLPHIGFWVFSYHSLLFFTIFYLWAAGNNVSITPLFIIVLCLGFTWLHILQYTLYITLVLGAILLSISLVEFNYFWFLEFVVLYLFSITAHILHVSRQCKLFQYQQIIEQERNVDSLTGLLNRRALEQTFTDEIQEHGFSAVILVDLDYFKSVNDTFGHAAGDQALTYAADIFKRVFRKGDLVARIGGDEFLIMLQLDGDAKEVLKRKVDLLLHQVPLTFLGKKGSVSMTFSVGAYFCARKEENSMEAMIKKADAAMYQVKQNGRNHALICCDNGPDVVLHGLEFPVKVIRL